MHRRFLLMLFAASVAASAAGGAEGVKLARSPKKGEAAKYRYEVKGDVAGVPFTATGRARREVTEVRESGEFTISETEEETKVIVMGMEVPAPPAGAILITRSRNNRLMDHKRTGQGGIVTPEVERLLSSLSEPLLSDKTVVGDDIWETPIDNPVIAGRTVKVKSKYAGTEKLGDTATWKITQTAVADIQGGELSHDATFWLDPANGQIVKYEAAVKNVPSQFGAASWTETQEREKA
jgi:hypothetical protein